MTKFTSFTPSWSAVELAWLTGLYEGEGYLTKQRTTKHQYWVLGITMTDGDVIARAGDILNCGSLLGPMRFPCHEGLGYKDTFRITVNAQVQIYEITKAMLPMLGARRAERVLEFHADYAAWKERQNYCKSGLHARESGRKSCRLCTNARAVERRAAAKQPA